MQHGSEVADTLYELIDAKNVALRDERPLKKVIFNCACKKTHVRLKGW